LFMTAHDCTVPHLRNAPEQPLGSVRVSTVIHDGFWRCTEDKGRLRMEKTRLIACVGSSLNAKHRSPEYEHRGAA